LLSSHAYGWASEPHYQLQNQLQESIRLEIISDDGHSLKTSVVKAGREIGLPIRRRRIVVHTSLASREYLVPGVLRVPQVSAKGPPHYKSIIDGNWALIVTPAPTLNITYIGKASVYGVVLPDSSQPPLLLPPGFVLPDFSKPPLLFPLRPRNPSETFAHYESDLEARTRSAILRQGWP
jgi:hypothetical protein